jgi:hypothetical protein
LLERGKPVHIDLDRTIRIHLSDYQTMMTTEALWGVLVLGGGANRLARTNRKRQKRFHGVGQPRVRERRPPFTKRMNRASTDSWLANGKNVGSFNLSTRSVAELREKGFLPGVGLNLQWERRQTHHVLGAVQDLLWGKSSPRGWQVRELERVDRRLSNEYADIQKWISERYEDDPSVQATALSVAERQLTSAQQSAEVMIREGYRLAGVSGDVDV